MKINIH